MNKKIVLFLILFTVPICARAQDSTAGRSKRYIGIAPQGLLNKFRICLEENISSRSTIGTLLSYHYGPLSQYRGPSAFFYYKYFIGDKGSLSKEKTTYLIIRLGAAYTKTPYYHEEKMGYSGYSKWDFKDGEYSLGYGIGAGIGKKWEYNKWFIDLNVVFQVWGITNKEEIYYQYSSQHYERYTFDYTYSHLSPGFFVSPTFIWGYVFK